MATFEVMPRLLSKEISATTTSKDRNDSCAQQHQRENSQELKEPTTWRDVTGTGEALTASEVFLERKWSHKYSDCDDLS